jgi:hypothetical protein
VPIIVLQALTERCGAASGGTHEEASCSYVTGRPYEVADSLVTEHGVKNEEGHHRLAEGRISGTSSDKVRQAAGFGYTFLEDLAIFSLGVGEHQLGVDGLVELTERGINPEILEKSIHAKSPCLVWVYWHDATADPFVAHELAQ